MILFWIVQLPIARHLRVYCGISVSFKYCIDIKFLTSLFIVSNLKSDYTSDVVMTMYVIHALRLHIHTYHVHIDSASVVTHHTATKCLCPEIMASNILKNPIKHSGIYNQTIIYIIYLALKFCKKSLICIKRVLYDN